MTEPAIIALTPRGQQWGRRIVQALGRGKVILAKGAVRQNLAEHFQAGRPLVCIMALGIVVRILGPLLKDKTSDPAVVVVDEAGRFAISVVGGHEGGANRLTRQVARALGAKAVITTASEALKLPNLDLPVRARGWQLEGKRNIKKIKIALASDRPVALYCEPGLPLPQHLRAVRPFWPIEGPPQGDWGGVVVVSDRAWPEQNIPAVIYRPPSLVLGIGCRRGVLSAEIEALFRRVYEEHGFSPLSLGLVVSATLKADEPGLLEFAVRHSVPARFFTAEELAAVAKLPTPSAKVREKIGVAGVAEPAAMLGAVTDTLLLPKITGERVTLAIARRTIV